MVPKTAPRLTCFHRLTVFFIPESRPEALEAPETISLQIYTAIHIRLIYLIVANNHDD